MASQPANAEILVARRVRSYRQDLRHNSVKDLAQGHFRQLVMSVPSQAVLGTGTLVTTAIDDNRQGLPVVVGLRPVTTLEEAAEGIEGLAFPIRLPGHRDVFLGKADASVADDLHQDLRDVK